MKRLNDRACDNFLNQQRAMKTAAADAQMQQLRERRDAEQKHRDDQNERDRSDLAYAHSTKLQPSEALAATMRR